MNINDRLKAVSASLNHKKILSVPKIWKSRVDSRVTEMAIQKAKVEIAKRGLEVSKLSHEQVELIVSDERDKILRKLKDRSWSAILIILGIQVI